MKPPIVRDSGSGFMHTVSTIVLRMVGITLLMGLPGATMESQTLQSLQIGAAAGVQVESCTLSGGERQGVPAGLPLFSFLVNESLYVSTAAVARVEGDSVVFSFPRGITGVVRAEQGFNRGWKAALTIVNGTRDTVQVANIVPLGQGPDKVYITATGPTTYIHRLSRSALFRPGVGAIGVVLPDNAWEMGFCNVTLPGGRSLVAIARRTGSEKADERRFRTLIQPGGHVRYTVYADLHSGDWHDGLRLMFRDRWLYDLESFPDTLFERKDLEWARHSYLLTLLFAWDQQYYDELKGKYSFDEFLGKKTSLLGEYDAFIIWPTWPRLGIDPRNQFDLYRDMPGGLGALRQQAETIHKRGGKYFLSYNPWDESTRHEEHIRGMATLLRATDADGVVLDTWGESSREFQAAADSVKPGIVLYSEGMAVPKDMPGIVAGRVHDALYLPPPLNLNKLIKPEFGIFRVMQVQEGRLHREAALCLFNGYGAELNVMRTGRPDWMDEEYAYLGLVVKTLRENSEAFLSKEWTPLIPTTVDSVWVNRWPTIGKTVYSVLGFRPEGYRGPLFEAPVSPDRHYVSLWHHTELETVFVNGKSYVPSTVEGFSRAWQVSRREGNVDCIAWLPRLLEARLIGDSLFLSAPRGSRIVVSAGNPSYATRSIELSVANHALSLYRQFGRYEGKFVVQLFDQTELIDERVVNVELGTPRLISTVEPTPRVATAPEGMVEIPGGPYVFSMVSPEVPNPVIPYPDYATPRQVTMPRYFIDRYPVTNAQFKRFLSATKYAPRDTTNFLRHWIKGNPPKGLENHPVVWVSWQDAQAYARWAGKRLPTDIEWQYAAQGTDGRTFPWGSQFDSTRCNNGLGHTTAVDAYPNGGSPFGVLDLVGNVWQLTNDMFDNCSYYFRTLRGGSYYNPTSSMWYVRGGPWQVNQHQQLLLIAPGFDRNSTVGFRCVKDAR